jgi:putative endonuclease
MRTIRLGPNRFDFNKQHTYLDQMKTMYVYITTNPLKTVLYTGVTNDLAQRLVEHYINKGDSKTFAGKFYCYNLIYFEEFDSPSDAIAREKEIKDWNRSKKEMLINQFNKDWMFLNNEVLDWPPKPDELFHRGR